MARPTMGLTLLVMALAAGLVFLSEASGPVLPAAFFEGDSVSTTTLPVFEVGKYDTVTSRVRTSSLDPNSPPHPLFVVSPSEKGTYPIVLFLHGTWLENYYYSQLFELIASHGYIVVAPQLCTVFSLPDGPEELEMFVEVANWLSSSIQSVLPEDVKADLDRLAVGGHSRGGKTAFALALGKAETPLEVKVSAVIGVDPVAGTSEKESDQIKPIILTYEPDSFDLSIPVAVIGTGLGNHSKFPFGIGGSCAPNKASHEEFFNECRGPCSHFVIKDYGHADMLNDVVTRQGLVVRLMCTNGVENKDPMRRSVSGIIVAFLNAYFEGEREDYNTILKNPSVAPATIYPMPKFKHHITSILMVQPPSGGEVLIR